MPDLRSFIAELERTGELERYKEPISARFQIASVMKRHDNGSAMLFEKVEGFNVSVISGVCGTRNRLARALRVSSDELHDFLSRCLKNPESPRTVDSGPVKEVTEKPKLSRIPILTHYEKDAGPYITSAIVSARTNDGAVENVSTHRLLVVDDDHLAIRLVPRHLYRMHQMAKESGKRVLDVGITIGLHPALSMAAASPAPFGTSEFLVANAMMRGELVLTECDQVDARVPADAEILLEGRILLDREVPEGPLVDITGMYDLVRNQPLVEVVSVSHREDYVYQALLPGGTEHKLLMGLGVEAKIADSVRAVVPTVRAVHLTPGGCGWLHAVVSIEKQSEGDGKNALLAAFAAHPSLKHAIVVDSDINVYDMESVEWAVATRFQADKGMILIPQARGSTLDPSSDQEHALTSKLGIDATRSLQKPAEKFTKGRIPGEDDPP